MISCTWISKAMISCTAVDYKRLGRDAHDDPLPCAMARDGSVLCLYRSALRVCAASLLICTDLNGVWSGL